MSPLHKNLKPIGSMLDTHPRDTWDWLVQGSQGEPRCPARHRHGSATPGWVPASLFPSFRASPPPFQKGWTGLVWSWLLQELRSPCPCGGLGERDGTFGSFVSILSVSADCLRTGSEWRTRGSQEHLLLPQVMSTNYRPPAADHDRHSRPRPCSIPWLSHFRWTERLLESHALQEKKRRKKNIKELVGSC